MENCYDIWNYTLLENQLAKMLKRDIVSKETIDYIPELISRNDNYIKIIVPEEPIEIIQHKTNEYQSYLYKCKICLYKTHTRVKVKKIISDTAILKKYICKKNAKKRKNKNEIPKIKI